MLADGGEVKFYTISSSSTAGEMPTESYSLFLHTGYEQRTMGINRQNLAAQFDMRADAVIRIPQMFGLDNCKAKLCPYSHSDSSVYKVINIQQIVQDDDGLPATDVTLEKLEGIDGNDII